MTVSIVIVDDDEVDRYLVRRLIASLQLDANVVEFEDGELFVDVLRDKERASRELGEPPLPILVLLDINMPRMSGFDVLNAMNEIVNTQEQFFFVTMYSSSSNAKEKADAEKFDFVQDYIVKPLSVDGLKNLIHRLYPADDQS